MTATHLNSRLEAFCDGVFAIALTLLIIDVKLPPGESIETTPALWGALRHISPTIFAFLLSFGVILITWVNHHAALKLISGSSGSFIYANGFLLLTVVFVPFPTGLVGEFLFTDHAAPAVVLYDAVLAVQAAGWVLVNGSAVTGGLCRSDAAVAKITEGRNNGYFATALYGLLAIAAIWFPMIVFAITTLTWIFWLLLGLRMKDA